MWGIGSEQGEGKEKGEDMEPHSFHRKAAFVIALPDWQSKKIIVHLIWEMGLVRVVGGWWYWAVLEL